MTTPTNFTPYQYSVIRYHHDPTTHEFLNVGLSLFAPEFRYFQTRISPRYRRITEAFYNADVEEYRKRVDRLTTRFDSLAVSVADTSSNMFETGPQTIEELLRKYLRKDATFRYSNPSSGIAPASVEAIDDTFNRLYYEYVSKYVPNIEKESRNEDEIWRDVYRPSIMQEKKEMLSKLQHVDIEVNINTGMDFLPYDYAWKNGRWHLIEPISFDLVMVGSIKAKAERYLGKNYLLNSSREVAHLYLLLGKPQNKDEAVMVAYQKAKAIVAADGFVYKKDIIEEDGAGDFARYLRKELEAEL